MIYTVIGGVFVLDELHVVLKDLDDVFPARLFLEALGETEADVAPAEARVFPRPGLTFHPNVEKSGTEDLELINEALRLLTEELRLIRIVLESKDFRWTAAARRVTPR
jgi:hypothetical protein